MRSIDESGYEPKDDFDAGVLFTDAVGSAADGALRLLFAPRDVGASYRWARLGVLQRVLEYGLAAPKIAVFNALHDVTELQRDAAWLGKWDNRAKITAALRALTESLAALRKQRVRVLAQETLLSPQALVAIRRAQ